MNRKYVVGGLLVVFVVVTGLGAALYTGVGPAPGGGSGDTIEEFPIATPTDGESDSSSSSETARESDSSLSSETAPFSFTIDDIVECGQTCRDVTATLQNNQDETATSVTVFTRIFAGENNTDTADIVWEGKENVGTQEAGVTHTTTERIELSLQEAHRIEQNDGWITILTTVQTDETTVTFQDNQQVT